MLAGRLFPRALAVTWLLDSNAAPLPGRRETMILVEGQPNDAYFPSIGLGGLPWLDALRLYAVK